jgi:CubicO group peptidase (beta-lactamase class C family)
MNFDGIDQFLGNRVDSGEIPGAAAAVVNRDGILYSGAFGLRDAANRVSMTPDDIFEIFSMTKPFTSVVVMMLLEEGKLGLDQPVSEFLPYLTKPEVIASFDENTVSYETKPAQGEITVRHLLTHTAGYGYMFFNSEVNLMVKKTGRAATELPLLFEPGTRWMYGPNTRVLGKAVEEITGMTLEEILSERICGPLGLRDTCYALPEEKYDRLVTTHRRKDGKLVEDLRAENPEIRMLGDTGLYSTAGDYATFLRLFLNGGKIDGTRLISEESVRMMVSNQIGGLVVETMPGIMPELVNPFPTGGGRDKFGLCFQITECEDNDALHRSHGSCSWAGMKNTFFWLDLKAGIAAVLMMQVVPFYDEACINVYRGFEENVYKAFG